MTRLLEHRVSAPTEARTREIAALGPWFHNLHLPDGSQTAPAHALGDFPSFKWRELAPYVPADLAGWRALDVGCNAGFYSFELARRGAHVVGIDSEPLFLRQAEWAAKEFDLADCVEFRHTQVYDLAHSRDEYDIVLFMGVFYHLRYPLLALDVLAQRTRRLMVFQTLTMPGDEVADTRVDPDIDDRQIFLQPGWPTLAFIEHKFSGDITNWWAPNHAAVEAMLRSSGLKVRSQPAHEIYICERNGDPNLWINGSAGQAELLAACGGKQPVAARG